MKYSYKLISEYIDGDVGRERMLDCLELLGLNPSVTEQTGDDVIIELETPANRGDLLSLIGVARDIVPFTPYRIKLPDTGFEEKTSDVFPVEIEDENDCFYYSCRIVKNIDVSVHPAWLKESIEKLGYRSGFNAVDISNYVMAETGQPLHIFDLDRLEGGIKVRRARRGESLVTIDGKKRELDEGVLVIADSKKVIAVAGIMGGANSEVNGGTKNILIESAVFKPVLVRRGSKKLGLATEASARFERGLDREASMTGMSRSAKLAGDICAGKVGPLTAAGSREQSAVDIHVEAEKVSRIAGLKIEKSFISGVLEKLNFKVTVKGESFTVVPPAYRKDIREDVDVIEEVVKYREYSGIPSEVPCARINPTFSSREIGVLEKIKDTAVRLGFAEVVNMGLTTRENTEVTVRAVPACLENPLSASLGFLRTSLIPEMLENARFNVNHEVKRLDIFELGKVYFMKDKSFAEEYGLSFVAVNSGDFLSFKGRIEKLLEIGGLKDVFCKVRPDVLCGEDNLDVYAGDETVIGRIFILPERIKTAYDLKKEKIYACEICMETIMNGLFAGNEGFRELPRYPSSTRDFSFILPEETAWQDIENTIDSLGLPVEKIEFFDSYAGAGIPEGSISISFSVVFRSPEKTMENEDVAGFSAEIVKAVCSNLKGILRGESADV